jgi:hypothetical protein
MTRTGIRANRRRTFSAILGGSALIAMGIIGVTAGAGNDRPTAVVSGGPMMTGETTTITFSGTIAPVKAVPPVKAKPYGAS